MINKLQEVISMSIIHLLFDQDIIHFTTTIDHK